MKEQDNDPDSQRPQAATNEIYQYLASINPSRAANKK
jgi:hypothetical protein